MNDAAADANEADNADDPGSVFTADPPPPAKLPPPKLPADPVVGLLCFRCGYDLRATDSHDLCPECGLPVATSVSSSMLAADGVAHGPRLRSGLVLLAVSLFMIPLIPVITIALGMQGSESGAATLFGLLVAVEHVLWVLGVWSVCGFAAKQPFIKGGRNASVARAAAAVCAGAAVITSTLGVIMMRWRRRSG